MHACARVSGGVVVGEQKRGTDLGVLAQNAITLIDVVPPGRQRLQAQHMFINNGTTYFQSGRGSSPPSHAAKPRKIGYATHVRYRRGNTT